MFKSEQKKHTKYAPGFLCQQNYAKKKVKIQLVWRNQNISRNKTCWKAKIASDPSTSSHHHNQVERWKYLTNVDWKWWFIDTRKHVSCTSFLSSYNGKNLIHDFWQIRIENLPFFINLSMIEDLEASYVEGSSSLPLCNNCKYFLLNFFQNKIFQGPHQLQCRGNQLFPHSGETSFCSKSTFQSQIFITNLVT